MDLSTAAKEPNTADLFSSTVTDGEQVQLNGMSDQFIPKTNSTGYTRTRESESQPVIFASPDVFSDRGAAAQIIMQRAKQVVAQQRVIDHETGLSGCDSEGENARPSPRRRVDQQLPVPPPQKAIKITVHGSPASSPSVTPRSMGNAGAGGFNSAFAQEFLASPSTFTRQHHTVSPRKLIPHLQRSTSHSPCSLPHISTGQLVASYNQHLVMQSMGSTGCSTPPSSARSDTGACLSARSTQVSVQHGDSPQSQQAMWDHYFNHQHNGSPKTFMHKSGHASRDATPESVCLFNDQRHTQDYNIEFQSSQTQSSGLTGRVTQQDVWPLLSQSTQPMSSQDEDGLEFVDGAMLNQDQIYQQATFAADSSAVAFIPAQGHAQNCQQQQQAHSQLNALNAHPPINYDWASPTVATPLNDMKDVQHEGGGGGGGRGTVPSPRLAAPTLAAALLHGPSRLGGGAVSATQSPRWATSVQNTAPAANVLPHQQSLDTCTLGNGLTDNQTLDAVLHNLQRPSSSRPLPCLWDACTDDSDEGAALIGTAPVDSSFAGEQAMNAAVGQQVNSIAGAQGGGECTPRTLASLQALNDGDCASKPMTASHPISCHAYEQLPRAYQSAAEQYTSQSVDNASTTPPSACAAPHGTASKLDVLVSMQTAGMVTNSTPAPAPAMSSLPASVLDGPSAARPTLNAPGAQQTSLRNELQTPHHMRQHASNTNATTFWGSMHNAADQASQNELSAHVPNTSLNPHVSSGTGVPVSTTPRDGPLGIPPVFRSWQNMPGSWLRPHSVEANQPMNQWMSQWTGRIGTTVHGRQVQSGIIAPSVRSSAAVNRIQQQTSLDTQPPTLCAVSVAPPGKAVRQALYQHSVSTGHGLSALASRTEQCHLSSQIAVAAAAVAAVSAPASWHSDAVAAPSGHQFIAAQSVQAGLKHMCNVITWSHQAHSTQNSAEGTVGMNGVNDSTLKAQPKPWNGHAMAAAEIKHVASLCKYQSLTATQQALCSMPVASIHQGDPLLQMPGDAPGNAVNTVPGSAGGASGRVITFNNTNRHAPGGAADQWKRYYGVGPAAAATAGGGGAAVHHTVGGAGATTDDALWLAFLTTLDSDQNDDVLSEGSRSAIPRHGAGHLSAQMNGTNQPPGGHHEVIDLTSEKDEDQANNALQTKQAAQLLLQHALVTHRQRGPFSDKQPQRSRPLRQVLGSAGNNMGPNVTLGASPFLQLHNHDQPAGTNAAQASVILNDILAAIQESQRQEKQRITAAKQKAMQVALAAYHKELTKQTNGAAECKRCTASKLRGSAGCTIDHGGNNVTADRSTLPFNPAALLAAAKKKSKPRTTARSRRGGKGKQHGEGGRGQKAADARGAVIQSQNDHDDNVEFDAAFDAAFNAGTRDEIEGTDQQGQANSQHQQCPNESQKAIPPLPGYHANDQDEGGAMHIALAAVLAAAGDAPVDDELRPLTSVSWSDTDDMPSLF